VCKLENLTVLCTVYLQSLVPGIPVLNANIKIFTQVYLNIKQNVTSSGPYLLMQSEIFNANKCGSNIVKPINTPVLNITDNRNLKRKPSNVDAKFTNCIIGPNNTVGLKWEVHCIENMMYWMWNLRDEPNWPLLCSLPGRVVVYRWMWPARAAPTQPVRFAHPLRSGLVGQNEFYIVCFFVFPIDRRKDYR
jgi:hypothetical protein